MTSAASTATDEAAARACMASLIGSLADNKAALGRRYSSWAVSAPTLESAVAAAAMAQDELGHARSSYPLLKQLGAAETDEDAGGDRRLALLDDDLPDWPAFVAANLVVDGMLTAFVGACEDSSFEQLAQRARKILQEEGSHRTHAEAWTRRICRAGGAERDQLAQRVSDTWEQVARWPGPADDAGFAAAVATGMVACDPGELRAQVRERVGALLTAEGLELELTDPADWAGWDPERRR